MLSTDRRAVCPAADPDSHVIAANRMYCDVITRSRPVGCTLRRTCYSWLAATVGPATMALQWGCNVG